MFVKACIGGCRGRADSDGENQNIVISTGTAIAITKAAISQLIRLLHRTVATITASQGPHTGDGIQEQRIATGIHETA